MVIPLGYPESLDTDETSVAEAGDRLRAQGVNPAVPIAWFVGSFGESYDLETVINAARRWPDYSDAPVQFVLSGDGYRRLALELLAHDVPSVIFTGWLDAAGIEAMRRWACVGLATYRPEAVQSLPNKIFEYMSAALPIVYSLGGNTDTLLREMDCGIRYSAGSSQSLASELACLLDDVTLRSRLANNSYSLFIREYSAEKTTQKFANHVELVARISERASDRRENLKT